MPQPLLSSSLALEATAGEGLGAWLDWLRYLLWPLFVLTAVLLVFYTFSLLTNLIAAPFNGLLAEAVEKLAAGPGEQS